MKKFSKIAKIESPKDQPVIKLTNEEKDIYNLRMTIEALVDEFLHLRIEGPINPVIRGTVFIDGKEDFINALIESLALATDKKELKVLESARNRFIANDLSWIENQIVEKSEKINEYQSAGQLSGNEEYIKSLYKSCKGDFDTCMSKTAAKVAKMKDGKRVFYRGMAAEKLSTKLDKRVLLGMAGIFMSKAKELGYSPQNSYFDKSAKKL